MTDDDHTNEAPDAAPESTGGPHGPQRLDDASPQGDDAGLAPEAESPPSGPTAPSSPSPAAEKSPAPKRAGRSQKRPAVKSGASRGRRSSRSKVPTSPDAGRAGGAGEGRASGGAAFDPRRVGSAVEPARSGRPARGAGGHSRAGAGPDSIRTHARVAIHVLPRRRLPDGVRSRGRPEDGVARPALRGCTPLQLRRIRLARPAARLRRQRLRRDAAGPVRVGPEATRRELRRRRPRPRLRHQTATRRSTAQ